MTHAYPHLCSYTAVQLRKSNNFSKRLHFISLSTQKDFYSCSFSFSHLWSLFFFNYYCYSSEEDTLPTTWKDNDPQKPNENIEIHIWKGHFLIVRMWHFIKTLPLFSSPGLVLLSVKVVYFLKIIFFILYLHGSVYILLLKKTCFGEKRSVKLWNQALN